MYHFRTRDDLLIAIQRHLTGTWEEQLLTELGKPLEQSTAQLDLFLARLHAGEAARSLPDPRPLPVALSGGAHTLESTDHHIEVTSAHLDGH
jgi:AcrR family transcriptional regulator